MTSLLALNCQRRILLTGTPVQNNLDEFFGRSDHQRLTAADGIASWLGTAWHSMAQHGTAWHSMAQHGTAWHSMAQHGTAWHSMAKSASC